MTTEAKERLSKSLNRLEEVINSISVGDKVAGGRLAGITRENVILTSRLEYLEARNRVLEEKLNASEGRQKQLNGKVANADGKVAKMIEKLQKLILTEKVS